ncbi:hypothetical protein TcCL_NonESM04861 [Trypanosoma cruzi]|nr:hypothetical protein TcCL_NonESM04861 [Trypanosoma cruzi]
MGAPNDALALRKDGRVPSSPGVSCAHSTVARCASSFTSTVATARRPGEVAHGITSSAASRRTHAARLHPDIDDGAPPVPAQKALLPEPKVLFVCVYRPPFAASLGTPCCVVQSDHVCSVVLHWAGHGMLFLCSLNRLEDGQSHFWAFRQHPKRPRPALRHRYSLSGGSI